MAIARATNFFKPGHEDVRGLGGVTPIDVFNSGILPVINGLTGADSVDLDMEDSLARKRRQQQALLDEELAFERKAADDAFLGLGFGQQGADEDFVDDFVPDFDRAPEPTVSRGASEGSSSEGFLGFVKGFEGFTAKPVGDYKQTSIGYGTRARKGEKNISKAEADRRLRSELSTHRSRVVKHATKHGYNFTEGQINALTSFDFNTGRLEQLTANGTRSPSTIAKKMLAYRKAGGKVLQGLVKRRRAEQRMFLQD